eukprot:CAMPEP_0113627988 /NCGR_PEP_ID=MMETSP0017_2-20120614/14498_1 /TAXON_ID=2856 /ORGANISM="Cylindrotheca closterium" /LENGTH=312 /DNA_ID=CAMNT_0000538269 /DNA_START=81 /DNA_END=1019 /DNA_ORIENTATION=- /assembly_acc=CAM_ASM_000147
MSTASKVVGIKKSLSKHLPPDGLGDEDIEYCQDMLKKLDECDITLNVLTSTLIGTVVSKFKKHEKLGPTAKALVKKWKKVAAGNQSSGPSTTAPAVAKKKMAPKAPQRRISGADVVVPDRAKEEWNGLASHRQNICSKLYSFLNQGKISLIKDGINEEAAGSLQIDRSTEVESAIQNLHRNDKGEYASLARSLCFNIKKNVPLACQILLGQIPAESLVKMSSEELASEDQRAEMANRTKKLNDAKRLDWDRANEDKINEMCGIRGDLLKASLFTCGRCKSIKTTSTQKQTRSADEPMTVFVLCLNCGNRWKC